MNLVIWVTVGLATGRVAQLLFDDNWRVATAGNLVVGVCGAVVAGWVLTVAGVTGVYGFSVWAPVAAFAGAVTCLWAGRAFTSTPTLH